MRSVLHWTLVIGLLLASPLAVAQAPDLRVEIEGVRDELLDNVRALLSIEQLRGEGELTPLRIRRLHARAEEEIRTALEPFGHYQVRVDSELREQSGGWLARYVIDPGPRVRLEEIDIDVTGEGADDLRLQAAVGELPLRQGDALLHSRYELARRGLLQQALGLGFLDARYTTHRLEVDVARNQARVVLELDTGSRYELGAVAFQGADLEEELLHAYVQFEPGDEYSTRQLLDLQRSLEDSDYFAQVQVLPEREQAQARRIPVTVVLKPRRPNRYTAGIGYGTDTGPRFRLGWENRRVNRSGHQMGAEYRVSEIRESIAGRYRIPLLANPQSDFVEFHSVYGREDIRDAESTKYVLGASHSTLQGRWRRVLSLTFQQEDFTIGLTDEDTALLMPGVNVQRVWGRERLIAERGARLQLDLKGAQEGLLSDTSFVQGQVDAKLIVPLLEGLRLIGRGTVGAIQTDEFRRLPPSIRYFAGGDQSVRGYDYNKLGPRDASGEVVGGRYLLVGSLELERHIRGNWRAALFFDTGNALDGWNESLKQGAGVGLRWETPIGLVRMDLATALSEDGSPWRLHLTLGPDL
jgi:translocation and assembly module TamA